MRVAMHDGASMTADWSVCACWHIYVLWTDMSAMRRRVCSYSPAKRLMNHPLLHMHHTQFQQSFLPSLHLLTWFGPLQTQPLGHLPQSLLFRIALWCFTTQHRSNKHVASCIQFVHYSWSQSCVGWPECQTNKYVWQCKLKHPCRLCMKRACTFHHGLAAVHICLATLAGSRHNSGCRHPKCDSTMSFWTLLGSHTLDLCNSIMS